MLKEPPTGNSRRRHGVPPARIQPHSHSLRSQDESDDRQAGQRSYDQCEDQKYLVLSFPQLA